MCGKVDKMFDDRQLFRDYLESLKDGQARIETNIEAIWNEVVEIKIALYQQEREIRLLRAGKIV